MLCMGCMVFTVIAHNSSLTMSSDHSGHGGKYEAGITLFCFVTAPREADFFFGVAKVGLGGLLTFLPFSGSGDRFDALRLLRSLILVFCIFMIKKN